AELCILLLLWSTTWQAAAADESRAVPLSPAEEQATFRLADDNLSIELVAAEPDVDSPVAIAWDADGRLYVAEMIDYPAGPTAGRIRLLVDADEDGRYETVSVFAAGLNFPNGVLAADGGVYVTAAPDILFLKDTDGDGLADERRIVFTGFGEGNQQLRANGLTWGLDGWIYGANGRSDGSVRRPDEPAEKAVSIRGRDFRFRPGGKHFEAISGQSQFGQSSDDWGNRFLSWNTIPVRQALLDQDFVDRNPRLSTYAVRDIIEPGDLGRVYPISPRPQTFNRERTDYFNALCGLTIFRGDALGEQYAGNAFVGESLTNLVHRRILMPEGPVFVAKRTEHEREFVAASDSWFHPVNFATGPDGALWIVDFYRRWVEHPAFVAEKLRGSVDWRQGSGHGRIWRVTRRAAGALPPAPRLSKESSEGLVQWLESPIGWRRDTAERLLIENRDVKAAPRLVAMLTNSRVPQAKAHALWTLANLGQLDDATLARASADNDPRLQSVALRVAAPRVGASPLLRRAVTAQADAAERRVRFGVCVALAGSDGVDKTAALIRMATADSVDRWTMVALVGSLGHAASDFLAQLIKQHDDWRRRPTVTQMHLLADVAATIASDPNGSQLGTILELIRRDRTEDVGPGDLAIVVGMAHALADRGKSPRLLAETQPPLSPAQATSTKTLVAAARAMCVDARRPLDERLTAIEVLGLVDADARPILLELLQPTNDQALQSAAANAVSHSDTETAAAMFGLWDTLTTTTRRELLAAAPRSPLAIKALVAAVESEQIPKSEVDAGVREALRVVGDVALKSRIAAIFQSDSESDRAAVVARHEPLAARTGDRARGARVFEKQCLTCHTLAGRGQAVGPDLSGIAGRAKETLLVDVLDPNRQIAPNFIAFALVTTQGQVLSGLLASETATSITLRRAGGGEDFVLRSQIEQLRSTGKSLMPEGLEQSLSPDEFVDLLEFLVRPDSSLFSNSP
ncbi:MAG TPA: PVC-type heme-binding CxxCH protein, partial [Pirellulales bacterium]|nr:PVC-type heme-binding CxxCH protein [Pirellulales bacterium]